MVERFDSFRAEVETTPFHLACEKGNIEIAKYLFDRGVDINCLNSRGKSPLIVATEKQKLNIVQYLLEKKADINIRDKDGNSALSIAINGFNEDFVSLLCDANAIINENEINQALITALANGKNLMAKLWIKRGADVNISYGTKKMTVLMFAADIPDVEWVKELVSAKQVNLDLVDESGDTVLMRLVKKIKEIEVKLFPEYISHSYKKCLELVEFLVREGSDIKLANKEGNTALHLAAEHISETVLKILIEKINSSQDLEPTVKRAKISNRNTAGSPVDVCNNKKRTPLHLAVANQRMKNIKLLVEVGANVHLKCMDWSVSEIVTNTTETVKMQFPHLFK